MGLEDLSRALERSERCFEMEILSQLKAVCSFYRLSQAFQMMQGHACIPLVTVCYDELPTEASLTTELVSQKPLESK